MIEIDYTNNANINDYSQLMRVVEKRARDNTDKTVDFCHINWCSFDNELQIYADKVNIEEYALGQLLNRLGIPKMFFDRNPGDIKATLFNYWNNENENQYFVRYDRNGKVRAVLSPGYTAVDDVQIVPILFENLNKDYRIYSYQSDNHITKIIVEFTDTVTEFNGKEMAAGLMLTNSETGYSSIWIEPIVRRGTYLYSNRNTLNKEGLNCRIVHRGEISNEKIINLIDNVKEVAQVGIVQLAEAQYQTVEVNHAVEFVNNISVLGKRLSNILAEDWKTKEKVNKLEAAQQILDLAAELPLFNRVYVEQSVGKFLGLFQGHKSRMALIAEGLKNGTKNQ